MSKKTLALLCCLALALAVGLGSSLAYLTDTARQVNTFTMGGVQIKVEEIFGDNTDFTEAIRPGGEVNKDVWITNTGSNNAYVWVKVKVPAALKNVITLHWAGQNDPKYTETFTNDKGEVFDVYIALDENQVPAEGGKSRQFLDKVTMSTEVDVVRVKDETTGQEKTEYYLVSGGNRTKIDYDLSRFEVIVEGYAIQAEGFATIDQAYAAYNTQWNGSDDSTGDDDDDTDAPAEVQVSTLEALREAIAGTAANIKVMAALPAAGETASQIVIPAGRTVTIDLGENRIYSNANVFWNNGGTLTLKNGTVVGGDMAVQNNSGTMTLDNVKVSSGSSYAVENTNGATLTITGGEFTTAGSYLFSNTQESHITITGGEFTTAGSYLFSNKQESHITITGGSFIGGTMGFFSSDPDSEITITGGTFDEAPSGYIANGYTATQNENGLWVVTQQP